MSDPQNILIIRLSAIGDVVFASPLIGALRRSYPQAKLSWLVEPAAAPLLNANPLLDEVIVWPKSEWKALWKKRRFVQLWRDIRSFTKMLKSKDYDLVLDLQGLQKSAVWAYLTGAPRRVGLGSKEGSHRLMTEIVSREGDDERIGSEYLNLAKYLGLDYGDFEMDIALPEDEDEYALTLRQAYGDYIVICPFTTRPQKHWVGKRWGELVEQLSEQSPTHRVVMLGGPGDREAAGNILSRAPGLVSMVGQCSISQTAALIKHAAALIGVDTGLTHMGIAFARPTVALFGSTCPYRNTTRENALVLYHSRPCSPCRRNPTCQGDFTCMKDISVDEVMDAVKKVGL
jgi:heptosyltransferase-1